MIRKFLCFFGYHCWTYTLKRKGFITEPLTNKILERAVCKYCNKIYGK